MTRKLKDQQSGTTASVRSSSNNNNNATNNRSTVSSSGSHAPSASRKQRPSKTARRVILGRFLFVSILIAVAVALGIGAYWLIASAENNLATTEYYSLSERAMKTAQEITLRKRLGTVTMAKMAASLHPHAHAWPFVTIPGYEVTTQNLIQTSNGREMGFCPLVRPHQLQDFEGFAYNYYYHARQPEVFPNTTAVSPFGRGVWGVGEGGRYHEVDGSTAWNSTRQILAPILHHNEGPFPALMLNLHFQKTRGIVIDAMMDCAEQMIATTTTATATTGESNDTSTECGAITDMLDLTSQEEGTGPGALIMQPIYATGTLNSTSNDTTTLLVGLIASSIVWDETLVDVFASSVSGIDCVLKTQDTTYTYSINDGTAKVKGEGDLHNHDYNDYRLSIQLTPDGTFSQASPQYKLCIYPNEEFFETYTTNNPWIALAAVIGTLLLTSLFFLSYDFCVRKDMNAKQELLAAKRNFLRFISHEVRTPLNAVCMGLGMLEEELRNTLANSNDDPNNNTNTNTGINNANATTTVTTNATLEESTPLFSLAAKEPLRDVEAPPTPPTATSTLAVPILPPASAAVIQQETLSDWLCLTQDVLHSAQNSVDVLSDILNYDKVENGSLSLDLAKVDIWELVYRTINEFRLSATSKQLQLECIFLIDKNDDVDDNFQGQYESPTDLPTQVAQRQRVIGDSVRITQVVRNLVSNAIKFTPVGGQIRVQAKWNRSCHPNKNHPTNNSNKKKTVLSSGEEIQVEPSGYLDLTVTDTGAGMNSEQLALLFSSGVQFNVNELQKGAGSGLGLFIAKGIVDSHGGSLEANSEGIGYGTTFELILPLVRIPLPGGRGDEISNTSNHEPIQLGNGAPVVETPPADRPMTTRSGSVSAMSISSASPAGKKLLVVDDAPINRKLLIKLLKRKGHDCEEACDGKECVDMIVAAMEEGRRYDTILLDYQMPVMDGPTAASEIRKLGCDSFIVGITGNVLPEDVMAFKAKGANAVLPKPFEMPALESLWMEYGIEE
ncbi:sensor kinase/phosphatase LuxQ [Seminavis robusta]|uniref:histidine kinase n=1 Tax=Seminavis robusta TaxID=568900 RepID=A0A9N8HFS8_9STRA|nr:sensor kinase/phosphatase LuxQ [Seminavis robusta]|eukprot:Sro363_g126940.1 sensor kinase/phosphatase LuxQ (1010) ;mRNA; r:51005-54241